ncbi:MAG TPA: hypothetical protein VJ842_17175 [Pyrinomonadaceae bacterium]|nr:hypothetical protein [Pyrinomonadaceae bacterium]
MPRRHHRCLYLALLACVLANTTSLGQQTSQPAATAAAERTDPIAVLRSAQTIFIRTKSVYFKPAALEQALLDRNEFQGWNMVISRDETDADLIIEVDRKLFTNRFVYSVIDPHTNRVLLSGKIGSLGGTVEGQIANGFVKRLQRFRPFGYAAPTK